MAGPLTTTVPTASSLAAWEGASRERDTLYAAAPPPGQWGRVIHALGLKPWQARQMRETAWLYNRLMVGGWAGWVAWLGKVGCTGNVGLRHLDSTSAGAKYWFL